jgi:hypothetical protein
VYADERVENAKESQADARKENPPDEENVLIFLSERQ